MKPNNQSGPKPGEQKYSAWFGGVKLHLVEGKYKFVLIMHR